MDLARVDTDGDDDPAVRQLEAPDGVHTQTIGIELARELVKIEARWEGPVPPPATLAAYGSAVPNGSERVMCMAELEQQERHSLKRHGVVWETVITVAGMVFGFLIALVLIGAATVMILKGHDTAGTLFGGGTLVTIVGIFVGIRRGSGSETETTSPPRSKRGR